MMSTRIAVGMGVTLVAIGCVLPATVSAQGRGPGGSTGGGARGGGPVAAAPAGRPGGVVGRPGFNGGHGGGGHGVNGGFNHFNGFNHRHFNSNSVVFVGPGPLWWDYSPPVVYSPPPVYYAPPVVYQTAPPASYYPSSYPSAPTAPPGPRTVEFPTGHYELRGDGMATPYTWVWIPNPPTAPPGPPIPAAPDAPPAGPTSRPGSPSVPPAKAIYRWTDENGVTVLTDDITKVPERYRILLVNRTHL